MRKRYRARMLSALAHGADCTCGTGSYCHFHLCYKIRVVDSRNQESMAEHNGEKAETYQKCGGGRRVIRKPVI